MPSISVSLLTLTNMPVQQWQAIWLLVLVPTQRVIRKWIALLVMNHYKFPVHKNCFKSLCLCACLFIVKFLFCFFECLLLLFITVFVLFYNSPYEMSVLFIIYMNFCIIPNDENCHVKLFYNNAQINQYTDVNLYVFTHKRTAYE